MARPLAVLRAVPDTFDAALRTAGGPPIDVSEARRQHVGYRAALEDGGFSTVVLPADGDHPDCPFIEDVAVVVGTHAVATRPGHPARRGEVGPVAEALRARVPVTVMTAPATLDGGDVLQIAGTIFVGRSGRTNEEGIRALTGFAAPLGYPVVPVDVDGILHLKSAVTAIGDHTVVVWPAAVDVAAFGDLEVVALAGDDPHAANVVRLPNGRVLVAAGGDGEVAAVLARRGVATTTVDVGEFAAADGGLTCLSIRLRSVLV